MIAEQRQEAIENCLRDNFNPSHLEVIDESHLHLGHVGAQGGKSHFRVIITCQAFEGQALLLCHRLIYQALGRMMEEDIHALAIEIKRASR